MEKGVRPVSGSHSHFRSALLPSVAVSSGSRGLQRGRLLRERSQKGEVSKEIHLPGIAERFAACHISRTRYEEHAGCPAVRKSPFDPRLSIDT